MSGEGIFSSTERECWVSLLRIILELSAGISLRYLFRPMKSQELKSVVL